MKGVREVSIPKSASVFCVSAWEPRGRRPVRKNLETIPSLSVKQPKWCSCELKLREIQ